jgi:single-stranded-DNA-specific exonuclease
LDFKTQTRPFKSGSFKKELQVDDIVATLLLQRGIETYEDAKTFFRPSFEDLHDPYLMKDMDNAVARIEKAISEGGEYFGLR